MVLLTAIRGDRGQLPEPRLPSSAPQSRTSTQVVKRKLKLRIVSADHHKVKFDAETVVRAREHRIFMASHIANSWRYRYRRHKVARLRSTIMVQRRWRGWWDRHGLRRELAASMIAWAWGRYWMRLTTLRAQLKLASALRMQVQSPSGHSMPIYYIATGIRAMNARSNFIRIVVHIAASVPPPAAGPVRGAS